MELFIGDDLVTSLWYFIRSLLKVLKITHFKLLIVNIVILIAHCDHPS